MGRNGAGKSTLLRLMKGLVEPTRGRVERAGEVALLLQNPGDYLLHEHAGEEAGPEGLARAGLAGRGRGEPARPVRRRAPAARARGGARRRRRRGGAARRAHARHGPRAQGRARRALLGARRRGGAAVMVATHDTEFAATFADRVVLLGQGVVIADGDARRGARRRLALLDRRGARHRTAPR